MRKIVVVAIVLLVCALILGVGGAMIGAESVNSGGLASDYTTQSFCDPKIDPNCGLALAPFGASFCDPKIDPNCGNDP